MNSTPITIALFAVSLMLFAVTMTIDKAAEELGYRVENVASAIRALECPKEESSEEGKD